MHLGLLAHLSAEPYKPYYRLSTKTPDQQIVVDAILERHYYNDVETAGIGGKQIGVMIHLTQNIEVHDDGDQIVNKDWLIRAKRKPGTEEYISLQYKFYRKDDE